MSGLNSGLGPILQSCEKFKKPISNKKKKQSPLSSIIRIICGILASEQQLK
jgi:hypothetical protein